MAFHREGMDAVIRQWNTPPLVPIAENAKEDEQNKEDGAHNTNHLAISVRVGVTFFDGAPGLFHLLRPISYSSTTVVSIDCFPSLVKITALSGANSDAKCVVIPPGTPAPLPGCGAVL